MRVIYTTLTPGTMTLLQAGLLMLILSRTGVQKRFFADKGGRAVPRPIRLNRYVYCGNNPLSYVDPTGLTQQSNTIEKNGITYDLDASYSGDQRMFDDENKESHCFPASVLKSFQDYFDFTNQDALDCVNYLKDNYYIGADGKAPNKYGGYYYAIEAAFKFFKDEKKVEVLQNSELTIIAYQPGNFGSVNFKPNDNSNFVVIATYGPDSPYCQHAYLVYDETSTGNFNYWQVWRPNGDDSWIGKKTDSKSEFYAGR